MKKILLACGAAALLASCETNRSTETSTTVATDSVTETTGMSADTGMATSDTAANAAGGATLSLESFMQQAADGNMAEIAHGMLAAQKASDAEVKRYGQMMSTDHTKAGEEMKRLAAKNSITLPDTISQMHQDMQKRLSSLSGAEFDKQYMNHMVTEHEKTVNLFTMGSQSAQDPDVRAFAQKTLPTLQAHLEQAHKLNSRLNGTR